MSTGMNKDKPRFFTTQLVGLVLFVLAVFGGLFAVGMLPRKERVAAITQQTREDVTETPTVTVASAVAAPPSREIILPATSSAIMDTPIYARAEGYLVKLRADIGDRVKKGQVLVELDTPELDQQFASARARLAQVKASQGQLAAAERESAAAVKLAAITAERWKRLVAEGVFSKQEGDDKDAMLEVRQAELESAKAAVNVGRETVRAQEAEVARLEQLASYKEVRAPFDGVITVRNCATGNLVSPNNQGRELFRMSNNDILRVFAALPQANVADVRTGDKAEVWIADRPNVRFNGQVARSANAIDEATRTQRTEVRVTNRDNLLLPGMYVQVRFMAAKPRSLVLVPGDTLVTKPDGSFVAVVDSGKVRMQKVSLGRDLGATVEVTQGLLGGESLIVSPSDAVRPGISVKPSPRK